MSRIEHRNIAVIGGGSVGKTACVIRFIADKFDDSDVYEPTIEDTFRTDHKVDGRLVHLDILDTAGQEEFSGLKDGWIKDSEGFIIMFNLCDRASFDEAHALQEDVLRVTNRGQGKVPLILVGNKNDKVDDRCVSEAEGKAIAKQYGVRYIETSAKTGHQVTAAFEELIRAMRAQQEQEHQPKPKKRCVIL